MKTPVSSELKGESWEVDRLEGRLLYLKGHPYPWKGYTTPEQMEAVNAVKRAIPTFFAAKSRQQAFTLLQPHFLLIEELSPAAWEIFDISSKFVSRETALIIAHVFEYDQAYRLRLQDLATETSKEKLSTHPIREILRLLNLNRQREYGWGIEYEKYYPEVHRKFKIAAYFLVIFVLLHPKKFRAAIRESNWKNLQLDEGDRYWCCFRTDYKFFGHSYLARQDMIKSNIWSLRNH